MNNREAVCEEAALLENRLEKESVSYYYQMTSMSPGKILFKSLVVVFVAAAMWSMNDHYLVAAWLLLMVLGIVVQDYVARVFAKQDKSLLEIPKWKVRLGVSRLYFGAVWGGGVLAFSSQGSVEHNIFLIAVALMLSFGSVLVSLYLLFMFYLYAGPMMLALVVKFTLEGTLIYSALAGLVILSFVISLRVAKDYNQVMRGQMRLRIQSNDLATVLQARNEEAQRGIKEKSQLLAAASHDLRQPLHAVQLFMNVFKDATSEAERARVFERIEISVKSLTRLFDSILDMSRLDAEAVKPEWSHFELSSLIGELKSEFSEVAEEKGLKLTTHVNKLVVHSDRELLERVLRNLISNAIRYTFEGGVLISARRRSGRVVLQVWDTGIGISDENKEIIFTEFQQLNAIRDERVQGFGLGLALVRRFCLLLGCPITLESKAGRGSVFAVTVDEGNASLVMDAISEPSPVRWDLTGRCIVVIDDEPEILDAMQAILTKWGCVVVIAESLGDALSELDNREIVPEMVLSDMRLRDNETGVEAINGVRERFGSQIPGALITGDSEAERIVLSKQSGYEVLQKPVQPAHIRTTIFRHLTPS